jgi:rhodanese-related sulfurtransferase
MKSFFIYFLIYDIDIYNIMTIKSSQTLVSEALKEIKTISTDDAHKMVNDNKCNLIDIRDIRELQKDGQVEGANHIPRGMLEFWLDPESIYFKEGKLDLNKEMVLFCAGGLRSALAAKSLKDMGYKKVSHIDGGFGAIRQSKFKVI